MPNDSDDLAAIAAVLVRYSQAMDERRWDLMETVFTEDAELVFNGKRVAGRERGVAAIRAAIECCAVTHHMNSNVRAEISGDTARVANNFRAWHAGAEREAEGGGRAIYEALGDYHDDFVRGADGRWLIRRRVETTVGDMGDRGIFAAAGLTMQRLIAESAELPPA